MTGDKFRAATLQKMIDRGEAATLEEAQRILAGQGREAAAANHKLGALGYSMNSGVKSAMARGMYTRYPGVRWRKDTRKWRVQFGSGGKQISVGSYLTEEEAARAHDTYVRDNGLKRPLHFPRDGEASSGMFQDPWEAQINQKQ